MPSDPELLNLCHSTRTSTLATLVVHSIQKRYSLPTCLRKGGDNIADDPFPSLPRPEPVMHASTTHHPTLRRRNAKIDRDLVPRFGNR